MGGGKQESGHRGPFGLHPGDSEKLLFKDFEQGNDMINLAF